MDGLPCVAAVPPNRVRRTSHEASYQFSTRLAIRVTYQALSLRPTILIIGRTMLYPRIATTLLLALLRTANATHAH
jgi:hypothetical protein